MTKKKDLVLRLCAALWLAATVYWLNCLVPGSALLLAKFVGGLLAVVVTAVCAVCLFTGFD